MRQIVPLSGGIGRLPLQARLLVAAMQGGRKGQKRLLDFIEPTIQIQRGGQILQGLHGLPVQGL